MIKLNPHIQSHSKITANQGTIKNHLFDRDHIEDGEFRTIPVEDISPDPNQPRKVFDPEALQELADSIKEHGVLQPIIVRKGENNQYIIISGERRYRATKLAGLAEISAVIRTNVNPSEIAIIENLQRENLLPFEEAEAFERMIREYGYTQTQLAKIIGKKQNTVSQILSLNRLPAGIKQKYPRADISKRTLIEIARQDSPEKMEELFLKAMNRELISDDIRNLKQTGAKKKADSPAVTTTRIIKTLIKSLLKTRKTGISEPEKDQIRKELKALKDCMIDLNY